MRQSVLLLAVVLSIPAFGQPRGHDRDRDDRDRDRDRYDGPPVVIPRGDVEDSLEDLDELLADAIALAKKDRKVANTLKAARETLREARDTVRTAPELRFTRRDRQVLVDLDLKDWKLMRHYTQWSRDWDDAGFGLTMTPPAPPAPQYPPQQPPYPPPANPNQMPQPQYPPPGQPQTQPQPQPPYTPPGQPQQRVYPITDAALRDLLASISREGFPAARVRVVEQSAGANYFLVQQVLQIIGSFSFSADRLQVIRVLRPRILDMENAHQLYGVFTFQDEKDQLRVILQ